MTKKARFLAAPYTVWAAGFIIIPLIIIIYYGFTDEDGVFTLADITAIASGVNLKALGLAFLLSLISTFICLLLAYPLAYVLNQLNMGKSSFMVLIFILPMWMNSLLRTIAWQNLLEKTGLINTALAFLHLPALNVIN